MGREALRLDALDVWYSWFKELRKDCLQWLKA